MARRLIVAALAACMATGAALTAEPVPSVAPAPPPGLVQWTTGNPADAGVAPRGGPALLLMGGSTEVDVAFAQRVLPIANGGDVVVLRTTPRDGYNAYFFELVDGPLRPDSVQTLVVDTVDKANSDYVALAVANAEFVFLAGGDQSTYINAWKGTRVEGAIRAAHDRGAVIGGTSAGLAVLGEYIYDPDGVEGAVSRDVLANPYHPTVALTHGFLGFPLLQGVLTDTHFRERDRMGRMLGFMARLRADGIAPSVVAMGVDESTTLFVDHDGRGVVDGQGAVYVVRETGATRREQVAPGQPLVYTGLERIRLRAGQRIDLRTWRHDGDVAPLSVDARNAAAPFATDPY